MFDPIHQYMLGRGQLIRARGLPKPSRIPRSYHDLRLSLPRLANGPARRRSAAPPPPPPRDWAGGPSIGGRSPTTTTVKGPGSRNRFAPAATRSTVIACTLGT